MHLDSDNAVRILLKYGTSGSERCHDLCKQIHTFARQNRVTLQPVWVPREENQVADALSKHFDRGDLREEVRAKIHHELGLHFLVVPVFTNVGQELEAYASKHNTVIVVYPAFFTQSWWPRVRGAVGKTIDLGTFDGVFHPKRSHSSSKSWRFRASVVDLSKYK